MAPRSQRLDPILKIKQRQQDEVAQQVAAREAAHAEQKARLDALQRYAAEYSATPEQGAMLNPALRRDVPMRRASEPSSEPGLAPAVFDLNGG